MEMFEKLLLKTAFTTVFAYFYFSSSIDFRKTQNSTDLRRNVASTFVVDGPILQESGSDKNIYYFFPKGQ